MEQATANKILPLRGERLKLTIVIPALNEEQSIKAIIERCLNEAPNIIDHTAVTEVGIVVVSDGSTDKTIEYAKEYMPQIDLVIFEKNRGYGAAIMQGWKKGDGELLAFIDADGTCNPKYFIDMVNLLTEKEVDVAIGSRMGPTSKMPKVRRLGNTIFRILLGLLARKSFTDTASGMRVVRKSSLPQIYPLPTGLHFTPAMSARILLDDTMQIDEIPMHYEEREGRSKLSVIKDGIRFLRVILGTAAYVRPSRLTLPIIAVLSLISVGYTISPIAHYAKTQIIEEWMIYRFITTFVLMSVAGLMFSATVVAEHMIRLSLLRYYDYLRKTGKSWRQYVAGGYMVGSFLLLVGTLFLIWPGVVAYVKTGEISPYDMHWSRLMVCGFFTLNFFQALATWTLLKLIASLNIKQSYLLEKVK